MEGIRPRLREDCWKYKQMNSRDSCHWVSTALKAEARFRLDHALIPMQLSLLSLSHTHTQTICLRRYTWRLVFLQTLLIPACMYSSCNNISTLMFIHHCEAAANTHRAEPRTHRVQQHIGQVHLDCTYGFIWFPSDFLRDLWGCSGDAKIWFRHLNRKQRETSFAWRYVFTKRWEELHEF